MHLPRSIYSETQLQGILWLLGVNHVCDLPSVRQMKKLNTMLQNICGIDTIPYNGILGHIYHVNSLSQILAQVCTISSDLLLFIVNLLLGDCKSRSSPQPSLLSGRLRGETFRSTPSRTVVKRDAA